MAPVLTKPTQQQKPYQPRGGALELLYCKDPEVLFDGPAGTGKTRAALEKLHILASKYPGARLGIGRKTRKSMTQSTLVTYENKVRVGDKPRLHRTDQAYKFDNDSQIVIVAVDDSERIKSTEFDVFYINEATEISLDEFEMIKRSLRNGVLPYQQLLADCNPVHPTHWINQRADEGVMTRIQSRHEDNPMLFRADGEPTDFGRDYLANLDMLTGVRYKRLRLGLWVAAEGLVYDAYDPDRHVVNQFIPPQAWKRYVSVDFGYQNPFVAQWWAVEPKSGRAFLYREIYHSQQLVEHHAHRIHELSRGERIEAFVTDHDPEDIATLSYHLGHASGECNLANSDLIPITLAKKNVEAGIHAVQAMLGNDKLRFMRDTVVEFDAALKERGRPTSTLDEITEYVWDEVETRRLGEVRKESPLKKNDHGMDAMRYFAIYISDPTVEAWGTLFGEPDHKNQLDEEHFGSAWSDFLINTYR